MRLSVVVITVSAALVLAVALAGAQEPATEYLAGYDVLRTGVSPYDFKFPPVLSWQFTTDEKNADEPVASVAVGPDLVYAPVGSNLYGLDRRTGQQKWKLSLGGKCFCTPVVAGDVVYVGTENKQLVAVSAKAGQRLWALPTTAAVRGEPLLFENVLYFGTDDGRLFALDLESRQLRWYFEAGGKIRGGPAYYRDAVYCASDDGYLYALSTKDGHQVWNTNLGTKDIFSSPVVARGRILIGAGNSLLAVDVANGAVEWSFQTYGMVAGRPALKDRMIFLGSADGSLYCLNAGTGKAIWRYPKQGTLQPITSSPSIQGDSVIFRSGPRLLVALSADQNTPADKRLVWQYTLPQPPARRQTAGGAPGAAPGGPGGMPGMPGMPGMEPGGMPGGMPGMGAPGGMPGEGGGRTRRTREQVEIKWETLVDSSVAMAPGSAYVIGDDQVVYAFDNQAADNDGPVMGEGLLDIRGQGGFQVRYRLVVDRGDTFPGRWADLVEVPGAPPISMSVVLNDTGCGVDPGSIVVKLDDQPAETTYDARQALLWYVYDPRGAAVAMRNGVRNLLVTCADWLGNSTTAQAAFTVDNSLPQPAPPTNMQPGGGMPGGPGDEPGMGMPGMPGMPGAPGAPGMPGMPGMP